MTNILLADIGGTHARLASWSAPGRYTAFKKYRLNAFSAFSEIIDAYQQDVGTSFHIARFAMARTPVNRVISYKRFAGDPDYAIDFNALEKQFGWSHLDVFNDLEVAAMGLATLKADGMQSVIAAQGTRENEGKVLISIGTGVGHAFVIPETILRTHGGHFAPSLMTKRQQEFAAFIAGRKGEELSLIAEDFVSSRGLVMCAEFITGKDYGDAFSADLKTALKTHPDIVSLFFECLGLHAHILASVTGFYGGVYITGGVMDHLVDGRFTDWSAFETFFKNKMVSVVDRSLSSTPVYYVLERELPLLGLTTVKAT